MFDPTSAKKGMLQEIVDMAREARAKQMGAKVKGMGGKLPDPAADASVPDQESSPVQDKFPGEDKPAAMPADGEANPELLAKLLELLTSKGV